MKKLVILFLLLIPIANALTIDPLPYNIYNLGDNIFISGSSEPGFVELSLNCNGQDMQLGGVVVIKEAFSKIIPITGSVGDCKITAALNNETAESNIFQLTKELIGKFTISHNEVQLGDEISIEGHVTKLNRNPIDGTATIYFKKEDNIFSINTVEIRNGEINHNLNVLIPAGIYNIVIEIIDNFGNQHVFDVSTIKVNTNLIIGADFDQSSYKPGDTLKLKGDVIKTTGTKPENLNLTVYLDNKIYKFTTTEFEIIYQIPKNTKSYKHDVKIEAIDEIGNKGIFLTQYYIEPTPTSLEIELNKTSFKPEEEITITPTLYDQANDIINDQINLRIKKLDYETTINSNQPLIYKIPKFSKPGEYRIKIESNDLKQERLFYIEEVKDLKIILNGQILDILNTGNIIFNDDLKIIADTEELVSLYIRPNTTYDLELYKLFKNGEYTIKIPFTGQEFYNVVISDDRGFLNRFTDFFSDATGGAITNIKRKTTPSTGVIAFMILILILVYVLRFSSSSYKRRQSRKIQREIQKGKNRLEELKKEGKKYKFDFGKATKEDINDFKDRVIKSYNEIERQERQHRTSYELDKSRERRMPDYGKKDNQPNNKGLFDMFG